MCLHLQLGMQWPSWHFQGLQSAQCHRDMSCACVHTEMEDTAKETL